MVYLNKPCHAVTLFAICVHISSSSFLVPVRPSIVSEKRNVVGKIVRLYKIQLVYYVIMGVCKGGNTFFLPYEFLVTLPIKVHIYF